MPTIFTHALCASIISGSLSDKSYRTKLLLFCALLSILPDIDVLAFYFEIPYNSFWGHRGFTHSLSFAMIVSLTVYMTFFFKDFRKSFPSKIISARIFILLVFSAASHSILDAMTNGGLGVAFLSPFIDNRYFIDGFQFIEVSPLRVSHFLPPAGPTSKVIRVFGSEYYYVLLPSFGIGLGVWIIRWGIKLVKSLKIP